MRSARVFPSRSIASRAFLFRQRTAPSLPQTRSGSSRAVDGEQRAGDYQTLIKLSAAAVRLTYARPSFERGTRFVLSTVPTLSNSRVQSCVRKSTDCSPSDGRSDGRPDATLLPRFRSGPSGQHSLSIIALPSLVSR